MDVVYDDPGGERVVRGEPMDVQAIRAAMHRLAEPIDLLRLYR